MASFVNILWQVVNFYVILIIIYCILSWVPHERGFFRDLYNVLGSICEPFLGLFRKLIPPVGGGGVALDISPIIAILVLQLLMVLISRIA